MSPQDPMVFCRTTLGAAAITLAAVLTSGCGGGPCGLAPNELEGSIGELVDIEVDNVRARKPDESSVFFEFRHGTNIVAKVVPDIRAFSRGVKIPLVDGDVYRVTSPATAFPRDIEMGTATIESDLVTGSEVTACFSVLFNVPDGTKRTLDGAIQTTLEGP